tara:strand:- start:8143 stop:9159 length:1017 start_codon:yes stop_codon:yes gene_type:complete
VSNTPAIYLDNFVKEYRTGFFRKRIRVVKGLSLRVEQGEIFGFLGPNGAGKTSTIKVLVGLSHPTAGRVDIFGAPVGNIQAKNRIGFLPEHPYFYGYLTGYEFLNFYARLFGIPRAKRSARIERLIEQVGISHAQDTPLRKYSKGMIQRVGIAQALLNDPDLVILDEPMSGLDPIGRKDVRDIILGLKENGKTVFFSSHILQDVEMICDRVAILNKGELLKVGPLEGLLEQSASQDVEVTISNVDNDAIEKYAAMADMIRHVEQKITLHLPDKDLQKIINQVFQDGAHIDSVIRHKDTLEDLFVRQVFGTQSEKAPAKDNDDNDDSAENEDSSESASS